jgi:cytochrome b561
MVNRTAEAAARRYTFPARLLHWLVAAMVLATIPIGTVMIREGISRPVQDTLFILHKNGGVIILLLVLARIAWRWANPPPPLPTSVPPLQRQLARLGHYALYAALLFMATTGYVRVAAGGFPIEMLDAIGVPRLAPRSDALAETAKAAHYWGRYVLILLVLGHVAVTLHHAFVRRDGIFWRMWPPFGR